MQIAATRYHDFSSGHRVVGHEGKCANLHGHNYRVHFSIESDGLDNVGRVLDFSVIDKLLCQWLENNWDHRMLIWADDPDLEAIKKIDPTTVTLSFNPTAENMGVYLMSIALFMLPKNVRLIKCVVEETRKCSVTITDNSPRLTYY